MLPKGHAGLNMALTAPLVALYPGKLYDMQLWLFIATFIAASTWPDIDLRFETKHRGFTHTLAGALTFGLLTALLVGMLDQAYAPIGFLGGFLGTLGHMLGDLLTYTKFRPLWPLSGKKFGLGLYRADNPKLNNFFARIGPLLFTVAILYRELLPLQQILLSHY